MKFKAVQYAKTWKPNILLTPRGVLVLLLGAWALQWIALPEGDLVVSMLSGAAIGLPLLSFIATLTVTRFFRKRLLAKVEFEGGNIYSKENIGSGISLQNSSLPPLFHATIKRVFRDPGVESPEHLISGISAGERLLLDTVSFSHRGIWQLQSIEIVVGDDFGLAKRKFNLECLKDIEVFARPLPILPLPIVAASARAGDLIDHFKERTGDPFDLKSYDPSDGVTRILWKTFAKSGELVVRRAEPSVVPEGEVAVFLLARPEDDLVAGAFTSYLKQLADVNVVVIFGTDGTREGMIVEESEIYRAIHEGVWSKDAGTGRGISSFLDAVLKSGRFLSQVVVFSRVLTSDDGEAIRELVEATSARGIKLSVATVSETKYDPAQMMPLYKRLLKTTQRKTVADSEVTVPGAEIIRCERSDSLR